MKEAWRIDRLTLQGFKSFAERTLLEFPDAVTGVIGPNGSGKSNLVEALRFVTGARAHELRGQELSAFLFHGAEGRPPLGYAEVRLELSRGRERLWVERRIEGERTFLKVNGRPASAKALALHLAGTGLGRGGYAIVGQGEVGALLEAPEEVLLAHLEEASGLRPVAEAAKATEERLKEALALLEEREKVLGQLKAEASRLEQEAEQAARARALDLEALRLKRSLLLARAEEAQKDLERAQTRLLALAEEEAHLQGTQRELKAAKEALKAEEESLRARLEAVRLALKEREALERECQELSRILKALDRPPPQDPGPPVPDPGVQGGGGAGQARPAQRGRNPAPGGKKAVGRGLAPLRNGSRPLRGKASPPPRSPGGAEPSGTGTRRGPGSPGPAGGSLGKAKGPGGRFNRSQGRLARGLAGAGKAGKAPGGGRRPAGRP
ncbi:AAA family ATPase [Thermus sp. 2.9]|uniref:AAA family ATPase n=1 Tax=Thermus sp. (strain 2.9) TaxID=1577051 RepID=UPI000A83C506|nr:AAA family ATPase [Thermus sp. 2.9]